MNDSSEGSEQAPDDEEERWQVLVQLEEWLDRPMLILSLVIIPLTHQLPDLVPD